MIESTRRAARFPLDPGRCREQRTSVFRRHQLPVGRRHAVGCGLFGVGADRVRLARQAASPRRVATGAGRRGRGHRRHRGGARGRAIFFSFPIVRTSASRTSASRRVTSGWCTSVWAAAAIRSSGSRTGRTRTSRCCESDFCSRAASSNSPSRSAPSSSRSEPARRRRSSAGRRRRSPSCIRQGNPSASRTAR